MGKKRESPCFLGTWKSWNMWVPTANGGMQNGSSVRICTQWIHMFARLAPICMPSRWLLTKFLHRSSVGSLLRVRCWLGRGPLVEKTSDPIGKGKGGGGERKTSLASPTLSSRNSWERDWQETGEVWQSVTTCCHSKSESCVFLFFSSSFFHFGFFDFCYVRRAWVPPPPLSHLSLQNVFNNKKEPREKMKNFVFFFLRKDKRGGNLQKKL